MTDKLKELEKKVRHYEQEFLSLEDALYEIIDPALTPLIMEYKIVYRDYCEARLRYHDAQNEEEQ